MNFSNRPQERRAAVWGKSVADVAIGEELFLGIKACLQTQGPSLSVDVSRPECVCIPGSLSASCGRAEPRFSRLSWSSSRLEPESRREDSSPDISALRGDRGGQQLGLELEDSGSPAGNFNSCYERVYEAKCVPICFGAARTYFRGKFSL